MTPETVLLLLAVSVLVAWISHRLVARNGKPEDGREATTSIAHNGNAAVGQVASNGVSRNLTKIVKNEESKLSIVVFNSVTNEILDSRVLDFQEASQLTGGFSNVCLNAPSGKFGAIGYEECGVIRRRR